MSPITSDTSSTDFPTTPGVFQATLGGRDDVFVARISPTDAPGVALIPGALTFANQGVGTTSPPKTAVLRNIGSTTLNITSLVADGDFAETNNCGGVPGGGRCTISVTFTPTDIGSRSGAITIPHDAFGSPHTLNLTGTGVKAGPFSDAKWKASRGGGGERGSRRG